MLKPLTNKKTLNQDYNLWVTLLIMSSTWGHFVFSLLAPKQLLTVLVSLRTTSAAITGNHTTGKLENWCHRRKPHLLPFKTDSATMNKIRRRGDCCFWVILMHLASMPGQVFFCSGLLHDNRELRYLFLKTAKIHICYSPKMFPGTHSVGVKQLNASTVFASWVIFLTFSSTMGHFFHFCFPK